MCEQKNNLFPSLHSLKAMRNTCLGKAPRVARRLETNILGIFKDLVCVLSVRGSVKPDAAAS